MRAGSRLREIRERLGLTIRDVEISSVRIARIRGNPRCSVPSSRLSEIETKGITPTIYKMYSLAAIYGLSYSEILGLYGINLSNVGRDGEMFRISRTHIVSAYDSIDGAFMPTQIDPIFDHRNTTVAGRMIVKWETVPIRRLEQLNAGKYLYGYIGTDDWTMFPLLAPGCFVQIDETRRTIEEGHWRSGYERPIYFLETQKHFLCSWCELRSPLLTICPHPLSTVKTETYRLASEIEVRGQVVGIAMRLRTSYC